MQFKLLKDSEGNNRSDMILMIKDEVKSFVPNSDDNADWTAYQSWLALGNEPEPAE